MDKLDNAIVLARVLDKFADGVQPLGEPHGLLTISTDPAHIIAVLQFLKTDEQLRFNYLTDITAVHYPKQELAFAVVYHLHNLFQNLRIRIKVFVRADNPIVPTATTVWKGANWMERETFDFYGIQFEGHPDLRRILNVEDMDVFPMRKEYPLEDPNRVDKKDFYFGR